MKTTFRLCRQYRCFEDEARDGYCERHATRREETAEKIRRVR